MNQGNSVSSKFIGGYRKFVRALGRINTVLLLTVVYWILMPIFSMLLLFKKKIASESSTWRPVEPEHPQSHEHQF